MREVGLDLQDYLPEMALSGSEESINTLEEEEDNDSEDMDKDGDISQENESQNPQPLTNINTETSSMRGSQYLSLTLKMNISEKLHDVTLK
jgi:hypothetical protein